MLNIFIAVVYWVFTTRHGRGWCRLEPLVFSPPEGAWSAIVGCLGYTAGLNFGLVDWPNIIRVPSNKKKIAFKNILIFLFVYKKLFLTIFILYIFLLNWIYKSEIVLIVWTYFFCLEHINFFYYQSVLKEKNN